MTVTLKHKKAKKLLKDLADLDLIEINTPLPSPGNEHELNWLPTAKHVKANQFLKSLKEAKLASEGKIKLKTLDEALNEL